MRVGSQTHGRAVATAAIQIPFAQKPARRSSSPILQMYQDGRKGFGRHNRRQLNRRRRQDVLRPSRADRTDSHGCICALAPYLLGVHGRE